MKCTILPNCRQLLCLFFSFVQIIFDLAPPLDTENISLRFQTLQLDLHPDDIPIERLEFIRFRFLGEPEGGGRFVHEVNRLVGEVAIGYVSSTIYGRCDQKNTLKLAFGDGIEELLGRWMMVM